MILKFEKFNESINSLQNLATDKSKLEEFIEKFSKSMGSCCEVWMDEDQMIKLAKAFASDKYKFKCGCYDTEKLNKADETEYDRKVEKMKKDGWKIFDEDENIEQTDVIFFKSKV